MAVLMLMRTFVSMQWNYSGVVKKRLKCMQNALYDFYTGDVLGVVSLLIILVISRGG